MSSIVETASLLGTEVEEFSTFAAIVVRAKVALFEIVFVLRIGTFPKSRFRKRVDLSASLTASLNLATSGGSLDFFGGGGALDSLGAWG
jgi:hypothetical protein